MRQRAWAFYVLAAAMVALGYFLVPTSTNTHLLLYNGIGLSAVIGVLIGDQA